MMPGAAQRAVAPATRNLATANRPQPSSQGRLVNRTTATPAMTERAVFARCGAEQALVLTESHRRILAIQPADFR